MAEASSMLGLPPSRSELFAAALFCAVLKLRLNCMLCLQLLGYVLYHSTS